MKIPRTVDEALKQGYSFHFVDGDKVSPSWERVTGWFVLEKDGHPNLEARFTTRYEFGRVRKATGLRAKKP